MRTIETVKFWVHEPHHRPWGFWLCVMWIVSAGMVVLGFLYLINFSEVAITSPAYAAILKVPGGLRTYGGIQLILGAGLGLSLSHPTGWSKRRLAFILAAIVLNGVYAAVTALAFFAAPAIAGGERNIAWVVWGILALIYMVALPFTPTAHGLPTPAPRDESAGDRA